MTRSAWSSGLSTNDFAACLPAGLQPLGFVQGCSVVSWSFYGLGSSFMGIGPGSPQLRGYVEQYTCPHGFVSTEHRMYGLNYEKTWIEDAWAGALVAATKRLVDEAVRLGAHGIIGIVDSMVHHQDNATFEISLSGTAVGLEGCPVPPVPFTTFLSGQKLNKLVEAGFAPVEIALGLSAVGVFSSCITEYQLRGGGSAFGANIGNWGVPQQGEIDQLTRAQEAARSMVRERVRAKLGSDVLHGATLKVETFEAQEGPQIDAVLRGNRVRRFKPFEEVPLPRPIVKLVDR